MNVITIPNFHIISDNGKDHYTVYDISVTIQGRTHVVQKRYSELLHIHKLLKKQVKVLQFPPKQLRNLNTKAIEIRRNGLEQYLQWVLSHDPHSNILLDLLNVPRMNQSSYTQQSMDSLDNGTTEISHCPVLHFNSDTVAICQTNITRDNIISGVFDALYS